MRTVLWHSSKLPRLVIPPTLSSLDISFKDATYAKSILSLPSPAYLQFIVITGGDPELMQESSILLLKCQSGLVKFCVDGSLPRAAFLHASQLPNLLFFAAQSDGQESLDEKSLPKTMFPSIRWLGMEGLDTESIWLQYLPRIRPKSLETLLLGIENAITARRTLGRAFANIQPGGSHRTLRELIIHCRDDFPGLQVDGPLVEHLLPLTQLTNLVIHSICGENQCGHKLSDEDLEKLVKTISKLQYLELGKEQCCISASNSVKSLVSIARHFKHLKYLAIHTNVVAVLAVPFNVDRDDPTLGDKALVMRPLRNITFGPCSIPGKEAARTFASTLLRLFPNLRVVSSPNATPQWQSVSEMIISEMQSIAPA